MPCTHLREVNCQALTNMLENKHLLPGNQGVLELAFECGNGKCPSPQVAMEIAEIEIISPLTGSALRIPPCMVAAAYASPIWRLNPAYIALSRMIYRRSHTTVEEITEALTPYSI